MGDREIEWARQAVNVDCSAARLLQCNRKLVFVPVVGCIDCCPALQLALWVVIVYVYVCLDSGTCNAGLQWLCA